MVNVIVKLKFKQQVQMQIFTFGGVKDANWIVLEEIGYKVTRRSNSIVIKENIFRKQSLIVLILVLCTVLALCLWHREYGFIAPPIYLLVVVLFAFVKAAFFKLIITDNSYNLTELNWNYEKYVIPYAEISKYTFENKPSSKVVKLNIERFNSNVKTVLTASKKDKTAVKVLESFVLTLNNSLCK